MRQKTRIAGCSGVIAEHVTGLAAGRFRSLVTLPTIQPTAHNAIVPLRAIKRHTSEACAVQWLASRTQKSATVIPATR